METAWTQESWELNPQERPFQSVLRTFDSDGSTGSQQTIGVPAVVV